MQDVLRFSMSDAERPTKTRVLPCDKYRWSLENSFGSALHHTACWPASRSSSQLTCQLARQHMILLSDCSARLCVAHFQLGAKQHSSAQQGTAQYHISCVGRLQISCTPQWWDACAGQEAVQRNTGGPLHSAKLWPEPDNRSHKLLGLLHGRSPGGLVWTGISC